MLSINDLVRQGIINNNYWTNYVICQNYLINFSMYLPQKLTPCIREFLISIPNKRDKLSANTIY